jgi:hypothetical protein
MPTMLKMPMTVSGLPIKMPTMLISLLNGKDLIKISIVKINS